MKIYSFKVVKIFSCNISETNSAVDICSLLCTDAIDIQSMKHDGQKEDLSMCEYDGDRQENVTGVETIFLAGQNAWQCHSFVGYFISLSDIVYLAWSSVW